MQFGQTMNSITLDKWTRNAYGKINYQHKKSTKDFAGSGVVHVAGGIAALVGELFCINLHGSLGGRDGTEVDRIV